MFMNLNLNLSTFSLLATCFLSKYVVHLAWKPPNPPPKTPYTESDLKIINSRLPYIRISRIIDNISFIFHCLIIATYPNPPSLICPMVMNITPTVVRWSPYTILCLFTIILSALLRLLTFKQLGRDFSFMLTKPGRLVTTGMYAYVQHPSYTMVLLFSIASTMFTGRIDGPIGCWLPILVARQAWWGNWVLLGFSSWAAYIGTIRRVKEEEKILNEAFGSEWEDWAANTARFVPWIY